MAKTLFWNSRISVIWLSSLSEFTSMHQISSKSETSWLICGALTISKKRPSAIVDFWNLQFMSHDLFPHAILLHTAKICWNRMIACWVMSKNDFEHSKRPPSWILKVLIFGRVTVIRFSICCSTPNFIKIRQFFTEIWRFNDFQNGGHPPSWIFKIYSLCHVTFVGMPLCFLVQKLAEIGQSVDELWPKKVILKMAANAILNCFWSHDCNRVQYLL